MAHSTKSFELTFKDKNGHDNAVIIDKYPDLCPTCGHGIESKRLGAYGKTDLYGEGHYVQAMFQCPRDDCQTVFLAFYTSVGYGHRNHSEYVFLRDSYVPSYFKPEPFDEEIEKLSPDFVKIYTQSRIAENMGLDLICGSGYRKALEFLIKDFLIQNTPTKKSKILESSLGNLIVNEVESEKVKQAAGLSKNIGNDETHYKKKMTSLTLDDLRKLTKITAHWISDELTLNGYLSRISSVK